MNKSNANILATCIVQAVVIGNILGFGVIIPLMITEVKTSFMDAGVAASLQIFFLFFGGILIPGLSDRFDHRIISILGAILIFGGLYGFSVTTSPTDTVIYIGFMCGTGGSAVYWASLSQIYKWNNPLGPILVFGTVGQIIYSFSLPPHLVKGAWRSTILTVAWVEFLVLMLSTALMFPSTSKASRRIGLREIARDRDGSLFSLSGFFFMFGFYAPFVTIIMDAQSIGASYLDASLLVGYMAVGSFLGKVSAYEISKTPGTVNTHRILSLLTFLTSLGAIGIDSYALLVIFSIIYGFLASGLMTTHMLICSEFWGDVSATSLLLAPGAFLSLYTAFKLIEINGGSTLESKIFVSVMYLLALFTAIPVKRRPITRPDLSATELI